jgi:hypothetical protein
MTHMNRRDLVKQGLGLLIAAPVGLSALKALGNPAAAGALKLVDPATDPLAKALGYIHDAKAAAKTDRKDKVIGAKTHKGDSQLCSNCALYAKTGNIGADEVGKCTMIASGVVKANGWCKSWSPKA